MKRIIALVLVLVMVAALASCTEVSRITIENPASIMVEKEGGGFTVTLTDEAMVERITDIACQLPLERAEATEDIWTYRITWQDVNGDKITVITIAGGQIRWEGESYTLGLGVDLSKLTDALETIPGFGDQNT